MKSASKIAVFLLAVALLVSCGGVKWTEYTSEDGGFSVLMPSDKVDTEKSTQYTEVGPIDLYMHSVSRDDAFYLVSYNDMDFLEGIKMTSADMNDILEDGVQGSKNTLPGGKFIYRRNTSMAGNPGKEYRIEGKKGDLEVAVFGKVYLVGTRLYQIVVTTTKENAESKDIPKFMESFRLM